MKRGTRGFYQLENGHDPETVLLEDFPGVPEGKLFPGGWQRRGCSSRQADWSTVAAGCSAPVWRFRVRFRRK